MPVPNPVSLGVDKSLKEQIQDAVQQWQPVGGWNDPSNLDDTATTTSVGRYQRGVFTKDLPDPEEGHTRTYFAGTVQAHRRRSLGLVAELMESQKSAKLEKNRLRIDDQETKIIELQHALIEEAKFLDRLKAYKPEEPLCCTGLTGERNSCCGPCIKCHKPCSCDEDFFEVEWGYDSQGNVKRYYCTIM